METESQIYPTVVVAPSDLESCYTVLLAKEESLTRQNKIKIRKVRKKLDYIQWIRVFKEDYSKMKPIVVVSSTPFSNSTDVLHYTDLDSGGGQEEMFKFVLVNKTGN